MSINQKDLNFNKSSNNETKKLVMKKKQILYKIKNKIKNIIK